MASDLLDPKIPRVGVGVIVMKEGKLLLGQRKGSHGAGTWCFPGGHLVFGEGLEECARREVMEETGLQIKNLRRAGFTNDFFESEGKHYVTVFLFSDWAGGEVQLREPEKCSEWHWFGWNELPKPMFAPTGQLLEQLSRQGFL